MPNLMQILSIFLKLQAVKQSGPGFLAYPVYILESSKDVPLEGEKQRIEGVAQTGRGVDHASARETVYQHT